MAKKKQFTLVDGHRVYYCTFTNCRQLTATPERKCRKHTAYQAYPVTKEMEEEMKTNKGPILGNTATAILLTLGAIIVLVALGGIVLFGLAVFGQSICNGGVAC